MDAIRFDTIARAVASRRGALRLGFLLGVEAVHAPARVEARKRRKRKRCRGAATTCGRACCASGGANPDCCPVGTGKKKRCTNLSRDAANCGRCGIACAAGKVCAAGLCWDPCPEPSGCFDGQARLCNGGNLCVSVDGVSVCAVGGNCFALTDCSNEPTDCQIGSACADICCGSATKTCRTPA